MNKTLILIIFCVIILFLSFVSLYGQELGCKAPALQISEWIKGEPVNLEKGECIYVLEFWATWCGNCVRTVPYLTELQKKYGSKVTIIGITKEEAGTIRGFMKEMGSKMDYTVALDRNALTSSAYMGAFRIKGIPHAFIVDREGKIVWHGHPMGGMDKELNRILADSAFDIKSNETFLNAVKAGRISEVRTMLVRGADVNAKSKESVTVLMEAAYRGYADIAQMLLDAGADVDEVDSRGRTAWIWAAYKGHNSVVQVMLDSGIDVNSEIESGVTALMISALQGNRDTVRILLDAGADVMKKDADGTTAEEWAEKSGHSEIAQLIRRAYEIHNADNSDYLGVSPCNTVLTDEEQQLYDLLMEYRASLSLPAILLSQSLSYVAKVHVIDLQRNPPSGNCNLHSWSDEGTWSSCCYTDNHARASCMWDKPRELTDYQGNGYEISSWNSSNITADAALKGWKKSSGHNSVIINMGMWRDVRWKAIGVGICGSYAVVWFGKEADPCGK